MDKKVDIKQAHEELLVELFGSTTVDNPMFKPSNMEVTREAYTKAMHKVQDKHGLAQGHPSFVEWVFTCIGQSPKIVDEAKGVDDDEPTTTTRD